MQLGQQVFAEGVGWRLTRFNQAHCQPSEYDGSGSPSNSPPETLKKQIVEEKLP
jgi:hypothetical protein